MLFKKAFIKSEVEISLSFKVLMAQKLTYFYVLAYWIRHGGYC